MKIAKQFSFFTVSNPLWLLVCFSLGATILSAFIFLKQLGNSLHQYETYLSTIQNIELEISAGIKLEDFPELLNRRYNVVSWILMLDCSQDCALRSQSILDNLGKTLREKSASTLNPNFLWNEALVFSKEKLANEVVKIQNKRRIVFLFTLIFMLIGLPAIFFGLRKEHRNITKIRELIRSLDQAETAANIGSWELDPIRKTLFLSHQTYRIFDIDPHTPDAGLFDIFVSRILPEDRTKLDLKNKIQSEKLIQVSVEVRIKVENGVERYVRLIANNQFSEEGLLVKLSGTAQDITKQTVDQNELTQRTHELDHFFYVAQDLLCIATTEGKFSRINEAFTKVLGWSQAELLANPFLSFIHPEDRAASLNEIQKLKQGIPTVQFENRYRCKDGSYKTLSWATTPDPAKGILYAAARDVTTDRAHHQDIREAQKRLEEAQSTAKIGSWEFNLITKFQTWSSEHYRIFEIPEPQPPELLYKLYRDKIHPEDLSTLDNFLERAISHGEPFVFDHRVILDSGTRIKYVQGIGKVKSWENGRPVIISGTCQDISARVQAEQQHQFILDALGIGIWKFNPNTQELFWDKSMYKLFEVQENDFSGDYQAWESSLTPENRDSAVHDLQLALDGIKDFDTTFEIRTKANKIKKIGGRGKVIRGADGSPMLMYGINWDRTSELVLEENLNIERAKALHSAKLASLGELAAGVAHEINNPLTIITGTTLLLEKCMDDPQKFASRCESINRAVERIARIIRGLRKFSRTSHPFERKPELLSEVIKETLVLTEAKTKQNGVSVKTNFTSPAFILCELVEIQQALLNLINNAIDATKFNSQKWIQINTFDDGADAVIQVLDSGPGLSPEVEAKLFQPFFTTKAVGEGTGLGLSIAKGIIEQHQGTLQLNKDQGSTCFEIRMAKAAEDPLLADDCEISSFNPH